ncbi:MAG: hypothetical protein LAT68_14295 [Cyclobacteriaceae bacterium]|nr:hypothetical protein [Cyclobacteriaceae bacterium]
MRITWAPVATEEGTVYTVFDADAYKPKRFGQYDTMEEAQERVHELEDAMLQGKLFDEMRLNR